MYRHSETDKNYIQLPSNDIITNHEITLQSGLSIKDRSFYPVSKNIRNNFQSYLKQLTLGSCDQDEIKRHIDQWRSDRKLFRPASQSDEGKTKFILVHQEHWQQRLLKMYGNLICLLDANMPCHCLC